MGKLNVTIIDAVGNISQRAAIPDDVPIGKIIEKVVRMMNLPTTDPSGAVLSYKFQHKNSGKQLDEKDTLAGFGVNDGDVLRLMPEITAG